MQHDNLGIALLINQVAVYLQSLPCHCAIHLCIIVYHKQLFKMLTLLQPYDTDHDAVYLQSLLCYCAVPIPI